MLTEFFHDERKGRKILKIVGGVIAGIAIAVALSFVIGVIVMLLWNWLMPELFGLGTINYWQGFGLVLFIKLLFSNGGSHNENKSNKRKKESKPETGNKPDENREYDLAYEQWWESEGRDNFEDFLENQKREESSEE